MKPISYILISITLAFVVSACTPTQSTVPTVVEETTIPIAITSTNTLEPTLTLAPTLNPDDAQNEIQARFAGISDCAAPCFWGITPDETTVDEARNTFAELGFTIAADNTYYTLGDNISGVISLYIDRGLVSSLSASLNLGSLKENTHDRWLAYSPATLVERYGYPSRVEFSGSYIADNVTFSESPKWYSMYMYFDDQNLIVDYEDGELKEDGSLFEACPASNQYRYVKLWFGQNPVDPPSSAYPLEEVSDLDIASFSAVLQKDPAAACFNLNK
ncbi:MAG TPA: hypothetical protein VK141_08650, partial [Nitrosomonas sp.]|nr:hypothetical protein [Nitrosomonas sp.]